jgi:hypothetical protein
VKYRNEEVIKELIVRAHQAGLCDKDGNSDTDSTGHMVPSKIKLGAYKTYVMRNGKLVLKELAYGT